MLALLGTFVAAAAGVITNLVTDMRGVSLVVGAVVLAVVVAGQMLIAQLQTRPAAEQVEDPPAPAFTRGSIAPPYGLLPPRLRGRGNEVDAISAALSKPDRQAHVICGLGGAGKTALALHLAGRFADRGGQVWWLSARDATSLDTGLRDLAAALDIAAGKISARQHEGRSVLELVWEKLTTRDEPWLLVIDNADEPELLAAEGGRTRDGNGVVRGSATGTVLVTSRVSSQEVWGGRTVVHRIGGLALDDATRLLVDLGRGRHNDARALAVRLGCLPLALRAAARSLSAPSGALRQLSTFGDYLRELDARAAGAIENDRTGIRTTWEISLDLLAARGCPHARPMMRLIGRFAAAPIPYLMLDPEVLARSELFGRRRQAGFDEAEQRRVIDALGESSLLDRVTVGTPARVECLVAHPLVVEVNLAAAREGGQSAAALRTALELIHTCVSRIDVTAAEQGGIWSLIAPHLAVLTADLGSVGRPARTLYVEAADRIARGLRNAGHFRAAYDVAKVAREIARGLPRGARGSLAVRHTFAYLTDDLGDFTTAEAEYRALLADQTRLLGARDPETLRTRDHLAYALNRQGSPEALTEYEAVLRLRVEVLGETADATLTTRNNLAEVMSRLGRFAEARAHFELVLSCRAERYGREHRQTLITRSGLAVAMAGLGDVESAELELRDVLRVRRRLLGRRHPATLRTGQDLAHLLAGSGREAEAVKLLRQIVKDRTDVLGAEHEDTRLSAAELNGILGDPSDV